MISKSKLDGSAFVTRHGPATSGGGRVGYNQYLLKDN
jgi:hypothetical protein